MTHYIVHVSYTVETPQIMHFTADSEDDLRQNLEGFATQSGVSNFQIVAIKETTEDTFEEDALEYAKEAFGEDDEDDMEESVSVH